MGERKALQDLFSFGREMNQHLPAILGIREAFDQSAGFHSVHQFDGSVMTNQQAAGNLADRGRGRSRQPLDSKQKLVLMWLEPPSSRSILGVMKELSNVMPKVGKRTIEVKLCSQIIS